jgi:hypothetical protein
MYRARATRLVADLGRLENRIERSLSGERGRGNGLRREAYLELLHVLNGTRRFETIPVQIASTQGLTESIYRRVNGNSGSAIARAIYESSFYDRSIESILRRREIHPSEWAYVSKLARALRVHPSDGQDSIEEPPRWMIDVDESHQQLRVWIREAALQDMLLASLETYLVPAGSGRPSTEVYGIVFGSHREGSPPAGRGRVATVDVNVERVCIQHRARGSPSEVVTDLRSEATQLAMAEELFPFWQLLGDFHTHTYRTLAELRGMRGWRYSAHDQRVNVDWCRRLRSAGYRPRVALILAIARAGRQRFGAQESWGGRPHIMRATIGRCHCFITGYRIRPDGHYSTDGITVKCPHLVGH